MSKTVNHPDSMNDTVETIGPVIQTFINEVVREEMPNCNYVFDPELGYESAIQLFRAKTSEEGTIKDPLPLFAFSRGMLRYPENAPALHRRAANNIGVHQSEEGNHFTYSMVYGEIELQFLYINKNMKEVEQFEINYLSNEGISGTRKLTLNLPDLGDFNYHIEYNDILDVNIVRDDTFYKGVAGSLLIRGFYFVFRSEASVIKEINCSIYQKRDNIVNGDVLLSSKTIQG